MFLFLCLSLLLCLLVCLCRLRLQDTLGGLSEFFNSFLGGHDVRRLPFAEMAEIRLIFFINSPSVCWELAHVLAPRGSGSSFPFLVIKRAESYPARPSPVAVIGLGSFHRP